MEPVKTATEDVDARQEQRNLIASSIGAVFFGTTRALAFSLPRLNSLVTRSRFALAKPCSHPTLPE